MPIVFATELDGLKARLLVMAGLTEHALHEAIRAVLERDANTVQAVLDGEIAINKLQIEMDDRVVQLLVREHLMAKDLRFALAVARINNDLERIGDQAVNIAQAAQRILQRPPGKSSIDISSISDLEETMFRDSLNAFVKTDLAMARSVLEPQRRFRRSSVFPDHRGAGHRAALVGLTRV